MKFNSADKILLAAFILFIIACALKIQYPSTATEFFLFITEAALVGGIADWFATEALFRKPLGFPVHTAIIPRRKDELAKASVKFIEQEFFSKKKIVKKVHETDLIPWILPFLENTETKTFILGKILNYMNEFLEKDPINSKDLSKTLANKFINEHSDELLTMISNKLSSVANSRETRDKIRNQLQNIAQQIVGNNPIMAFFAGIATSSNILDFDEAADIIQREFSKSCTEIKNFSPNFWQEVKIYPFIERIIYETIEKNLELIKNPHLQNSVVNTVYDETVDKLKNDPMFQAEIEKALKKIAGKAGLNARTQISPIILQAFKNFSNDDLIHLIRDKVETDLIWIRKNGSIVGSIVGVFIFVVLQLFA